MHVILRALLQIKAAVKQLQQSVIQDDTVQDVAAALSVTQ